MVRHARSRRGRRGPSAVLLIILLAGAAIAGLLVVTVLNQPEKKSTDDRPQAWGHGEPVRYGPEEIERRGADEIGRAPLGDPLRLDPDPKEPVGTGEDVADDGPEAAATPQPDPSKEVARAERPPAGPTPEELEALARRKADRAVLAGWPEVNRAVGEDARGLRFEGATARIDAFVGRLRTQGARAGPLARLGAVRRQARLYGRTVEALGARIGRKVTVRKGLTLELLAVTAERIEGRRGPARMTLRWTDLSSEDLCRLVASVAGDEAETLIDLAVLDLEHGQTAAAEAHLLHAFRKDAAVKPAVDETLAASRGEEAPTEGYVVHEDAWVRPEEKVLLEQGFRKWKGEWLTQEEYMAARGYVRHEDRWITREASEALEEQRRELADLAAKHLPKGLIDKAGHGEAVDWSDARVVKTKHYRIRTNLSADIARDVAYTMEVLNWNFRRILGLKPGKRMPKFEIQVCRSHDEYRTVLRGRGLGQAGGGMIKTFYQPPRTTAVLMHEGTHQFVYKIAPTCPRWVHEGMATYFECSRFRFDEKTRKAVLDVGLLNRHRLMGIQAAIRADRYEPMEMFLDRGKGNPYTQGWSVIYYLAKAHDGKYARRLLTFVEDAGKGSTLKKFMKIFRIRDIQVWEEDWRQFVMGLDPADGVDVFVPENPGGMPRREPGGIPPPAPPRR